MAWSLVLQSTRYGRRVKPLRHKGSGAWKGVFGRSRFKTAGKPTCLTPCAYVIGAKALRQKGFGAWKGVLVIGRFETAGKSAVADPRHCRHGADADLEAARSCWPQRAPNLGGLEETAPRAGWPLRWRSFLQRQRQDSSHTESGVAAELIRHCYTAMVCRYLDKISRQQHLSGPSDISGFKPKRCKSKVHPFRSQGYLQVRARSSGLWLDPEQNCMRDFRLATSEATS